ncbi:hypothetical protein [Peribacillus loiseleuriae]|uniref:hypothetical protein n=1 Tax=Peribacillus loiseleuriae TaxID=1679170 RepID=UPI003D052AE4
MEFNEEKYNEITNKLTNPFPKGTVTQDGKNAYIPIQAYIKRLEEAAGMHWSWRTTGAPLIYENEKQIMMKGILTILGAEREGSGFSNFQTYEDSGKIQFLKNSIRAAESDAIRDACNKFMMGWVDLAPYRDWSNNPGVKIIQSPQGVDVAKDICIKCKKSLTREDIDTLTVHQIRNKYCKEHIPTHLMKKRG